jgi:hypothetical protein
MNMKKKIFAVLLLIFLITPVMTFAATPCMINKDATGKALPVTPAALPQCVNQIYVWSLGVASLLALLMMVIGGYYYMTASGNAERSGKGVEILWSSVIGLALLFGAYLLLNTINPDLVNFSAFTKDFNCTNVSASNCPLTPTPATPGSGNVRTTPTTP